MKKVSPTVEGREPIMCNLALSLRRYILPLFRDKGVAFYVITSVSTTVGVAYVSHNFTKCYQIAKVCTQMVLHPSHKTRNVPLLFESNCFVPIKIHAKFAGKHMC